MNTDNHMEKHATASLIGLMRDATWTLRAIASVVIICFGGLVTTPAIAAISQEVQKIQWHKTEAGPGAKLSERIEAVHDRLDTLTKKGLKGAALADMRKQFSDDADALAGMDKDTLASFAATRAMIQDKHLPDVIVQREIAAETHYKTEMTALRQGLAGIVTEKDDAKALAMSKDVLDRLSKFQMHHSQQKFDPKNLPNRSLKPDLTRKPLTTKKQFAEAGFIGNPRLMVATTAPNFDYSQLPGANNPAYLAATTEVTLSPAIHAQAAALNYNPVQIYNWVRNNIQWQPTWGAVQDADLTLSAQRGNAFDISSLLIALLRASNIPARYVLGTVNVPADKFRNWVGGFQDINAAVNYASAGGIPITSLYSGGKITTIQMQHIWVEAAIDYIPSHGAINKSADAWVPMDASYKQYQIKQGLDIIKITGVDIGNLTNQFLNSGTINNSESYATGLNSSVFANAEPAMEQSINSYIAANMPNATPTDISGGLVLMPQTSATLSISLPYGIQVVGTRYAQLPTSLEQQITFAFGVDDAGDPINPVTYNWSTINNQLVTISFLPATEADQEALNSFAVVDPTTGQLSAPQSVPAYLVNVIPTLRINGEVVLTGSSTTLGADVAFEFDPKFAGRSQYQYSYDFLAGSYEAFAAIGGNVSPAAMSNIQQKLQQIANYENGAPQPGFQVSSLTNDSTFGNMFEAGLLGYYVQYMESARLLGVKQGGQLYLAAGLGNFGIEPEVNYAFGIPQTINGADLVLNLPMVNIFGYDSSNSQARLSYVLEVGMMSSLYEYAVPNQMFPDGQLGGASAETALAAASAQGQDIYNITQANQSAILPQLHLNSAALSEITDGLAAGKSVVTHSNAVTVPGWSGVGYIIYDPSTGDGAYKIAGGANGWKGEFDAHKAFYESFWELFLYGFGFIKALRLGGMLLDVVLFISDLQTIYSHCSGALYVRYVALFTFLTIAFIALAAFATPGVALLGAMLAPWIEGPVLDMALANCDSHPNS